MHTAHTGRLEKISYNIDLAMHATKDRARSRNFSQRVLNALNHFMLETIDITCDAKKALEPPDGPTNTSSDEDEDAEQTLTDQLETPR